MKKRKRERERIIMKEHDRGRARGLKGERVTDPGGDPMRRETECRSMYSLTNQAHRCEEREEEKRGGEGGGEGGRGGEVGRERDKFI